MKMIQRIKRKCKWCSWLFSKWSCGMPRWLHTKRTNQFDDFINASLTFHYSNRVNNYFRTKKRTKTGKN